MNADEIRNYLAQNQLDDSWWVMQDGNWLDSEMSLDQIEALPGAIKLLHVSQGDLDPPPTIDFQKKASLFGAPKKAVGVSAGEGSAVDMMSPEQRAYIVSNRLFPTRELNTLTRSQAETLISKFESKQKAKRMMNNIMVLVGFLVLAGLGYGAYSYNEGQKRKKAEERQAMLRQKHAAAQAEYEEFQMELEDYKKRKTTKLSTLVPLQQVIDQGFFDEFLKEVIKIEQKRERRDYMREQRYEEKKSTFKGKVDWSVLKTYATKLPKVHFCLDDDRALNRLYDEQTELIADVIAPDNREKYEQLLSELKDKAPAPSSDTSVGVKNFAEKIRKRMFVAGLDSLDDSIRMIQRDMDEAMSGSSESARAVGSWAKSKVSRYLDDVKEFAEEYKHNMPESRLKRWKDFYEKNHGKMEMLIKPLITDTRDLDEEGRFEFVAEDQPYMIFVFDIGGYNYYAPIEVDMRDNKGTGRTDIGVIITMAMEEIEQAAVVAEEEIKEPEFIEKMRELKIRVDKVKEMESKTYIREFQVGSETKEVKHVEPRIYTLQCTIDGGIETFYLITETEIPSYIASQILPREMYKDMLYTKQSFDYPEPNDLRWTNVR